jgi:hypothetical protein
MDASDISPSISAEKAAGRVGRLFILVSLRRKKFIASPTNPSSMRAAFTGARLAYGSKSDKTLSHLPPVALINTCFI